jgi:hypothetical protein
MAASSYGTPCVIADGETDSTEIKTENRTIGLFCFPATLTGDITFKVRLKAGDSLSPLKYWDANSVTTVTLTNAEIAGATVALPAWIAPLAYSFQLIASAAQTDDQTICYSAAKLVR